MVKRSLVGGWKARGKDISKGDSRLDDDDDDDGDGDRHDHPRSRRTNYRSSPAQSLAAHAGSGVSYSHPGPQ